MTDIALPSKGNIRFRWYTDGAFANEYWPTVTELNAGQELEQVVDFENFEAPVQASDDVERNPIGAKATVTRRGAPNYGATYGFDYPGYKADTANAAALVYAALGAINNTVNVPGYLAWSIDGEIGELNQPPIDLSWEDGDYVNIIKVTTDAWEDEITGEEDFTYSRTFLKRGLVNTYTVASTATPVLAATIDSGSLAIGDLGFLTATVNGREFTRGATWTSSDPTVATVSRNGIVTAVAAGSATITASLKGSNVTDTVAVTVS